MDRETFILILAHIAVIAISVCIAIKNLMLGSFALILGLYILDKIQTKIKGDE